MHMMTYSILCHFCSTHSCPISSFTSLHIHLTDYFGPPIAVCEEQSAVMTLPDELLVLIISKVPAPDLIKNVLRVCKKFHSLGSSRDVARKLVVGPSDFSSSAQLYAFLQHCKVVKSLSVIIADENQGRHSLLASGNEDLPPASVALQQLQVESLQIQLSIGCHNAALQALREQPCQVGGLKSLSVSNPNDDWGCDFLFLESIIESNQATLQTISIQQELTHSVSFGMKTALENCVRLKCVALPVTNMNFLHGCQELRKIALQVNCSINEDDIQQVLETKPFTGVTDLAIHLNMVQSSTSGISSMLLALPQIFPKVKVLQMTGYSWSQEHRSSVLQAFNF